METLINFSGIGFEVGQSKRGLIHSTENARSFFPALRDIGLNFNDFGDVPAQDHNSQIKVFSESDLVKIEWEKYKHAYGKTLSLLNDTIPLLNWGGDHSIAISTVGAFSCQYPDGFVLWIDAHADLNLPRKSLTGNFHGMPLSVLLNLEGIATEHFKWLRNILDPKKLIYLGLRDVDSYELSIIESLGIKTFFYEDILNLGINNIAEEILKITNGYPLHISFDIDSIDPSFAPSTGVQVEKGLTPNDLNILGEQLSRNSRIQSIDIVEVNPSLGTTAQVDQTYLIAFNFLRSIFNNNNSGGIYDGVGEGNQRKQFSEIEWFF
ncbi:MAG: arginase family protein [Bacteriovorax sp.]|nr:arginase family protein [Bacteriovorax sp.]